MKNSTLLASLGLASLLLWGCCPCALKHNNCPQKHPAAPVVVATTPAPVTTPTPVGVPDDAPSQEVEEKAGWEIYALAGGVIALGLGVQFFLRNKKK